MEQSWDFEARGGIYSIDDPSLQDFFRTHGFVVVQDVLSPQDNAAAIDALVADVHEINPATSHISDPGSFLEEDLPTSPNHTFRTTCNMAFGRFAWFVRGHPSVRNAFALLHSVESAALSCSWDNPFYTPRADATTHQHATQLHWDHNYYYRGTKAPLADELCVQGVYYAAGTSHTTPSFVCCPKSHLAWRQLCESENNPSKAGASVLHYLPVEDLGVETLAKFGIETPVQIHVPSRGLLLWDSRLCHGNTSPSQLTGDASAAGGPLAEQKDGAFEGRLAFAVCFGPTVQRTEPVHKEALLKGLSGIRTTHHPVRTSRCVIRTVRRLVCCIDSRVIFTIYGPCPPFDIV